MQEMQGDTSLKRQDKDSYEVFGRNKREIRRT